MTVHCCAQDLALAVLFPLEQIQSLNEPKAVYVVPAWGQAGHNSLEFCRESV
jgi:hypothetical protein